MSRYQVCLDFYHPDYIVYQEIRGEDVKVCAFCRLDKIQLTIVNEDGTIIKVDKKQASINYKRYLDELSKKPKIAEIVQNSTKA
jgi:predicted HAD superfamily phosphohydrolase YqeG